MIKLPYHLRVIIYCEEKDCWIAHCLEMDLVAHGLSPIEAVQHLRDIIDFQISSILETGNLESLFSRAPDDIVDLFNAASDVHLIACSTKYVGNFSIRIKRRLT
jgi:predicted RNase H-like HicB family nuclease